MIKKIVADLLKPYPRLRSLLKSLLYGNTGEDNFAPEDDYKLWISSEEKLFNQKPLSDAYKPLISILVPCYNTPAKYILPLIESVIAQTYGNWELIIADGSSDDQMSDYIKKLADTDKRIHYIKIEKNEGIVGNTNIALAQAHGDFVAFLDHDDALSPHALSEVVFVLNKNKNVDLLYSDEDKLSDDGSERLLPFFKPDWSPELLLGVNYITHFVVARRSIVEKIGGLSPGFDGAQDYDFLLRFSEESTNIVHIPKILYHWRLAEGSTSKTAGEKNYADTAGRRALKDAVKRRAIAADIIEISGRPTNYRLRYKLAQNQPKVSIIIPFKDKADLLRQCVESIRIKTTYKNYEIILVSNNSSENKTHRYLGELDKSKRCKIFYWDKPFNYSAVNNFGRKQADGEFIIFLNNDTKIITPTWIEELVGVASQKRIGAVGPLLIYPDKTIQHAGVIVGMMGMAAHVFRLHKLGDYTEFGLPDWPRNYLAVTGACLAVKAKVFDSVGGFDERFIICGSDVSLCIALYNNGYRNVFWPFARLYHYESQSVGSYSDAPMSDTKYSLEYYQPFLDNGDPFFNPNLDLSSESIKIRQV